MANLFTDSFFRKQMGKIKAELGMDEAQIEEYIKTVQKRVAYVNDFNPETDSEEKDWPEFERDVFRDLLGYKIKGDDPSDYNVSRQKRIKEAGRGGGTGKADCTLGFYSKKRKSDDSDPVIVEFKAPNTPNLDDAVKQLWEYMLNHEKCKWGIVSNFNEIILYSKGPGKTKKQTFYFIVPDDLKDRAAPLIRVTPIKQKNAENKEKNETEDSSKDEKKRKFAVVREFVVADEDGNEYDYRELVKFLAIFRKDRLISEQGDSPTDRMLAMQGTEEKKVEKEFYEKYYRLRIDLFNEIAEHNPQYRKKREELVSITQKILDRLIFIWFCEDSREELLPRDILQRLIGGLMKKYPDTRSENDVWDEIRKLFKAIDDGKGYNIGSGYNGELFKPDSRIDELVIPNRIFEQQVKPIGEEYDFGHENELSVNILGHIFEQSITDLEELKQGEPADKKTGKRKREGVYYTPEYITRYIVQQALGGWLAEREKELGKETLPVLTEQVKKKGPKKGGKPAARKPKITEKIKKELQTATGNEALITKLGLLKSSFKDEAELRLALSAVPEAAAYMDMIVEMAMPEDADLADWYVLEKYWRSYREVLKNVKVLDPACGSGAFLIQAFDYLHDEGMKVNSKMEELGLGNENIFDLDKEILENNLYGVDINDESVEITKLSLWLKTASKHKKLNNLFNNIKCGNSLIDDPKVAGKKAFKWEKEFPEIMKNGGFDVVIGNPPYVRQELLTPYKPYFSEKYRCYSGTADLYVYFYEKGLSLLKENGFFTYISNSFTKTTGAGIELRHFLKNSSRFISFTDFSDVQIFDGATTYPVIITVKKEKESGKFAYLRVKTQDLNQLPYSMNKDSMTVEQSGLEDSFWVFESESVSSIKEKIKANPTVKDIFGKCYYGIKTGLNEAFIISGQERNEIISKNPKESELIKPFLEGKDIKKWYTPIIDKWILFIPWHFPLHEDLSINGASDKAEAEFKNSYPCTYTYLHNYKDKLENRNKAETGIRYEWYALQRCAASYFSEMSKTKIIWPNLQVFTKFSYDESGAYINAPSVLLPTEKKYLLCIVNSKVAWFFFKDICAQRSGGYIEMKPQYFEQLPVAVPDDEAPLTEKADTMLDLNRQLAEQKQKLTEYLTVNHKMDSFSQKLQHPENLEFADFIKELKKKKVNTDDSSVFESLKNCHIQIRELKTQIDQTDREIDQMVYDLYGLTVEERKIVEKACS